MADAAKVPVRIARSIRPNPATPSPMEIRDWAAQHGLMVSPHGRVPGEIVELYKNATAPTATYKSVYLADASGDIAAGQRQADWKKFGKNLLLAAVAALIIFALMVAILFTV